MARGTAAEAPSTGPEMRHFRGTVWNSAGHTGSGWVQLGWERRGRHTPLVRRWERVDLSVCSICLFPGAQYPAGNSLEGHGPEHRSWDPPATLASLQTSLNKKPRLLQNSPDPASPCRPAGDGRPAAERGWRRRGRIRGPSVSILASFSVFHVERFTESV